MARVLIVEDSLLTSKMEQKYLRRAGHQTQMADTGRKALEMVRTFKPDLILLDYILPDLDGMILLKQFLNENPRAVVVMVTGQGDEQLAVEVIKAGAKDYVVKNRNFFRSLVHVANRVLKEVEIRRRLEEKNAQAERLAAQNELSFWVAQNFRNLFTGAMGFLELIDFSRLDQPEEKRRHYHAKALETLHRASHLVDQLLNLTEISPLPPTLIDFGCLVDVCLESAARKARSSDRAIPPFQFVNRCHGVGKIMINVGDADLVLENLLINALEALDGPGLVEASAAVEPGGVLKIKLRDDGRGMSAETRAKALTPMFTTKGGAGVGLGLSLVQSALRRHGGEMTIESEPGQGTMAAVTWPLQSNPTISTDPN
ncbi:MAG: hybrid sensor histidine kinase/response regulator [Pseudomonadota bacterium]